MPKNQKTQTQDWEFASIRLPKELMKKVREDAYKEMRPIGLHISYIIKSHLEKRGK